MVPKCPSVSNFTLRAAGARRGRGEALRRHGARVAAGQGATVKGTVVIVTSSAAPRWSSAVAPGVVSARTTV